MVSSNHVHVVVACYSDLALLPLGDSSVVSVAVQRALRAKCTPSVSVWIAPAALAAWEKLPARLRPLANAETARSLAEHAREVSCTKLLVHDATRPLTESSTFDRVAAALDGQVTAVRPAHVVVDTLKELDSEKHVVGTFDRNRVLALTSPEGYISAALVDRRPAASWTLAVAPLQAEYVRGDQESLKVREPADVLLVESFLAWQTREGQ